MNKGFFTHEELIANHKPRRRTIQRCGGCKLNDKCLSPNMPPSGEGRLGLLFLAEAPGEEEDRRGTQLIGKAGQYLRQHLRPLGIDLDRDARKHNAVTCRPPNNRTPTPTEVEGCRPMVFKELKEYPPKVVVLLGGTAVRSYFGDRADGEMSVGRWRGRTIPDQENNCWVCPTFHPSYLLRGSCPEVAEVVFNQDLRQAVDLLNVPIRRHPSFDDCIWTTQDEDEAIDFIQEVINDPPPVAAVDYETTGIKPHAVGHRIVCASIADSPFRSGAFPVTEKVRPHLKAFLESPIPKIAANLGFEDVWSRVLLDAIVDGWTWDTVLAAHVHDNRRGSGVNGVKSQALFHFGVMDYSSHISPFLRSKDDSNANAFNRIHEVDIRSLLRYCAIDSLVEHWLGNLQMELLGRGSIWTWW